MIVESEIRVRYGETDQMGVVYYGNYALYLEEARTDLIRRTGTSYKALEEQGIILPVVNLQIKYQGSARYDDLLTMKTFIKDLPNRTITFVTNMFNEKSEQINVCEVTLIFMNKQSKKVITCPPELLEALKIYVQE